MGSETSWLSFHVEVFFERISRSPSLNDCSLNNLVLLLSNQVLLHSQFEIQLDCFIEQIDVYSDVFVMLIEKVVSLVHLKLVFPKVVKARASFNEHLKRKFEVLSVPDGFLNRSPKTFVSNVLLFHSSIKEMGGVVKLLDGFSLHGWEVLKNVVASESSWMIWVELEQHVDQVLRVWKHVGIESEILVFPSGVLTLGMKHHIKQDLIAWSFRDRHLSDILHVNKRQLLVNDLEQEFGILSHLGSECRQIGFSCSSSLAVELQLRFEFVLKLLDLQLLISVVLDFLNNLSVLDNHGKFFFLELKFFFNFLLDFTHFILLTVSLDQHGHSIPLNKISAQQTRLI